MSTSPQLHTRAEDCVEEVIRRLGTRIGLGVPIAIGKPNRLVNAFFRRAQADPAIQLSIFTGLSLERPRPGSDVEARFLDPLFDRLFGDYEELDYLAALRGEGLPPNIRLHEFYFRAGAMKGNAAAQQDYISSNYTLAARDMLLRGMNVVAQLVASRELDGRRMLSLGSNADTMLDLFDTARERRGGEAPLLTIGQVHPGMPFMYNRALQEPAAFDLLLEDPAASAVLFAPPNEMVSTTDHAIGLHASTLLRDGGTLQIGIGSLGDAIAHASLLRHRNNAEWCAIVGALGPNRALQRDSGGDGPFEQGLYGCSEMFVNGFLHLMRAGIVRRRVYDDAGLQRAVNAAGDWLRPGPALLRALRAEGVIGERLDAREVAWLRTHGVFDAGVELSNGELLRDGRRVAARLGTAQELEAVAALALGEELRGGIHMHGGFFLGPRDFYQALREMPRAEAEQIGMDSVRCINRIDEPRLREAQRLHARFINTGMMVTLSGAVASDALESGEVISGVGGQYNFVAQAHELPGARSTILLRATRGEGRAAVSNIVPRYGHATIPRHLRDIVITEYGAADLRGATDAEIAARLIGIADSRFQPQLVAAAIEAGRLPEDYEIPEQARANDPARIEAALAPWTSLLPAFPLGTDYTPMELALGRSLREIKALLEHPARLAAALLRSVTNTVDAEEARPWLERMDLVHPEGARDKALQHLLLLDLEDKGILKKPG